MTPLQRPGRPDSRALHPSRFAAPIAATTRRQFLRRTTKSTTPKYGTDDVPVDPQRVVLMENRVELEAAVALGLSHVAPVPSILLTERPTTPLVLPPRDDARCREFSSGVGAAHHSGDAMSPVRDPGTHGS